MEEWMGLLDQVLYAWNTMTKRLRGTEMCSLFCSVSLLATVKASRVHVSQPPIPEPFLELVGTPGV